MKFATKAIHAGQASDPTTGATVIPIHLSTTFTQHGIDKHLGFEYSRTGNPTRQALETCLASLEEGQHGLAFASGMAAATAALSLLRPGDHIISAEDIYGGTYRLFEKVCVPLGITTTYVDGRQPEAFEAAFRPETKMVWIESPTNPLLTLVDIAAVAQITRTHGALLTVDNTFATPYLQRPLTLGAHLIVHSTTKYIGGHSDVIGGAVITNDEDLYKAIRFHQNAAGAVPGPFDCWLTVRGVKTLAVRMRQHVANAQRIAEYLSQHPKIERVHYPGLPSHPQYELAKRQMAGPGGMVTCDLCGGYAEAETFLTKLKVFSLAESLGGVESLAGYPAVMTHGSMPKEEQERRGIQAGTVRLSVGIEDVEDLITDLEQALA